MISLDWLNWLGDTVQTIGELIPRRVYIEPSQVGIKFKNMTEVIILETGIYWYIPFFSRLKIDCKANQTLCLGNQIVLSKDNYPIKIESSIIFQVTDFETAVTKFNCYLAQIDDDARNVICLYINSLSYENDIIGKLNEVNEKLTELVRTKISEYGIIVHRVQLTTVVTGIPLLNIENKSNG